MDFGEIDEKLSKVNYEKAPSSHLTPNELQCKSCQTKICTIICPANVYEYNETTGTLIVRYENCLECGACRIACEKSCIDWKYPKDALGVTFKYS